ncbi:Adenine/guanine phosphoribosyltransferase and related PRPP-binding protein [Lachnospiraceae bacterium TWA4]|nr:Adenine/guanine phosphoribosyltransferase and related PRPP-binding protein [Lachnospiraceae bacterium TWA4]
MKTYSEHDLVKIAKRENNPKRDYLVVNPLQGKHVPVSPTKALKLFFELSSCLKESYKGEQLLIIGFAETATAIGAQVAIDLCMPYIQTTREELPNVHYLYFSESHSHATEQKLVKEDMDQIISTIDRIVFVEDEVTTGNTILQIVNLLKKTYQKPLKFSVASLLNGMNEESLSRYKTEDIPLHYLVKTNHTSYGEIAKHFKGDGVYYIHIGNDEVSINNISGFMDTRRIVDSSCYQLACQSLSDTILQQKSIEQSKTILVIGTEECMYPALYFGSQLEKKGFTVKCHSTTRSPIIVSSEETYPLHSRHQLKSLYDANRKTFIYDLEGYDEVFIITDAALEETTGLETLLLAVSRYNDQITVIRWC